MSYTLEEYTQDGTYTKLAKLQMFFVHPGTGPILEAIYDIVITQASESVTVW